MRRSSSAFLEEEAVDRYLYAWVRTGEGLALRRFSSQNFYVPGVKLWYTSPRSLRSLGELGVEGLVNRVFPGQPAGHVTT